eukprot:TRINITY_DN1325_c0_g1_i1.p1 TRINITY_DN1325_c0_g1~~TRINITY_DN1325_c0_g1_i1.p1  ORF type:complete len:312 (-),score=107.19 TRINITY_DN1325_c0_g1_i1:340-1275(-)
MEQQRLDKFSFVFIPVDVDRPLEEWEQEQPEGEEVECFTSRLQQYFRETTDSNANSREVLKEQLQSQVGEGTEITDEMIQAVSGMQLVEALPLQSGTKANNFVHVNLYCDDSGTAKGSPRNPRASAISEQCGLPRCVNGDAFVARLVDDGNDLFHRYHFTLAELASDAEWLVAAKTHNLSRNAESQISQMQQLAGPGAQVINPGSKPEPMLMDESVPSQLGEHTWTQDDSELEVRVLCPANTKAKDIKCTIKSASIEVKVATLEEVALQGALAEAVDSDDTNWSIESAGEHRMLVITMAKANGGTWTQLMR